MSDDKRSDNDKVICPACNNEFKATPVNVQAEIETLRQWKREATEVLQELDEVWGYAGKPGPLGTSKAAGIKAEIEALRQRVEELGEFNLIHKDENKLLREELAELRKAQGEPIAFIHRTKQSDHLSFFNSLDNIPATETYLETVELFDSAPTIQQAQGEPIGVVVKNNSAHPRLLYSIEWKNGCPEIGTKLYTSAPTIPEGWQLVPLEPTKEMIAEFWDDALPVCLMSSSNNEYQEKAETLLSDAYKSMLSAAPKP